MKKGIERRYGKQARNQFIAHRETCINSWRSN